MKRSTKRRVVLLTIAGLGVLAWPGPASAATSLGGYSGSAVAEPVRIEIFEPVIPIPATPQLDVGIAYTQVSTDTGPVSRALASYLWPGPVVGDGFGTLTGSATAKYPIQVNSRNPPTKDSPAKNTAQLTAGNGMTTQSNNTTTRATATGLGISGPDTNLLGGLGLGLGQLGGQPPSSAAPTPKVPVPVEVSKMLAGVATVGNVKSVSDVTVGKTTITSTAHAFLSGIKLLGGIITIGGVDITATTVSNGKSATNTAKVNVGDVKVAGMDLGLNEKGLNLAGTSVKLPKLPTNAALAKLGISFKLTQIQKKAKGATASFGAQGLTISIDTKPLKKMLGLSALTDPLAAALSKIPNLGGTLGPALGLGPKFQIELGNVSTSATAAPAYVGGAVAPPPAPPKAGTTLPAVTTPGSGGGAISGGGGAISGGGGAISGGTGSLGSTGTAPVTGGGAPVATASSGYVLPPLGAVPKALIIGGLILAGAIAWALRNAGGLLFGGASGCDYGLESGVPDLRKG